jgi:hypothetical protein
LGVKWYGEGPFLRETLRGTEVKASKLFRVETGDIIYNRLFAWKGSFGIIPPEYNGCFVSNEFPTFVIKENSDAFPEFITFFLKCPTVWNVAERLSTGTSSTSRNRFSEKDFLSIPYPKLSRIQQENFVSPIASLNEVLLRTKVIESLCRQVLVKWTTEFGTWVADGWHQTGTYNANNQANADRRNEGYPK